METTVKGRTRNRLTVLYMLRSAGMRLLEEQITRISCDLSLMEIIDVKMCIAELRDGGLIAEREAINGVFFVLTPTGENSLDFYTKEINWSSRQKIDDYMRSHREELEMETRIFVEYFRITDSKYRVNMRVMDGDITMFEVGLLATSKTEAAKMADGWRRNAMKVYTAACEAIFAGEQED